LYKIPANTLFMGKNLVFVPDCPSTNTLALEISQHSPVKEGTLVITDNQTAGKGQRGNVWEAEPRQNLTFSLILKPGFLAISKQFFLNIVICLALRDYLKEKISDNIYIKWPNDILVPEKKISGVLIENQLQGGMIVNAIAGIGFNVNQVNFGAYRATSLAAITGKRFNLEPELHEILGHFESRYLQLRQGQYGMLMNQYLAALFQRHAKRLYSGNGIEFEGVIEDLDESGRLRVRVDGHLRSFGIKEIQYL
jgi:BirA family biotin operon repressor/biotin-[acetyl-CoA-carboxylase] ligase